MEIAVQRIHQLDDSYNYLSHQQQSSSQTAAILADCLDRLLSLKKRSHTYDFNRHKKASQLPKNPLIHLQTFFDGVDWNIVSPLDFQPMQMVLLNQDWIRYQFFDASINTQTDQAALMDFREQGILKTLMHIDKESIAKHRPSYQINTHDLHKNADDIELGAQIFRRLQSLGVINSEGAVQEAYKHFDPSKTLIPGNATQNKLAKDALLNAISGSKSVNLDRIDIFGGDQQRYNIKLHSPDGQVLNFFDVLNLATQGHDADTKLENANKSYGILLDIFKSMTGLDQEGAEVNGQPLIRSYDKGFALPVYKHSSWMGYQENSGRYEKTNAQPLLLFSKNKADLEAFYHQVREQLAILEPLVVGFMKQDQHLLSHGTNLKVNKIPLQVLIDNQGIWDAKKQDVIRAGDANYRVGLDQVTTPDYFQSDTMQQATQQFKEDLEEFLFMRYFQNLIYSDLSKTQHEKDMKVEEEKKRKLKRLYSRSKG